jgi:calcineurin-like phosphoesterase family protein
MINVGVDAWAYKPVGADALHQLIAGGPADLAPLASIVNEQS